MGHDVQVRMLFDLRDFWELLAPDCADPVARDAALAGAAFASFQNLRHYWDFLAQKEAGSTEQATRVGLWAKKDMTSPSFEYLSTSAHR